MESIFELNDHAAFLIECGQYKYALEVLNHCLMCLQKCKEEGFEIDMIEKTKAVLAFRQSRKGMIEELTLAGPSSSSATVDLVEGGVISRDSASFLYRHPHRLSLIELSYVSHDDAALTVSSTLIFNMALTHHLIAVDTEHACKKRSTKRLLVSLKLYGLCFQMHTKMTTDMLSMNYALAVINNCGLIHDVLGRPDKAEKFYSHLLLFLMMMIEGEGAIAVVGFEGFLHNAFRLILNDGAAAAA